MSGLIKLGDVLVNPMNIVKIEKTYYGSSVVYRIVTNGNDSKYVIIKEADFNRLMDIMEVPKSERNIGISI